MSPPLSRTNSDTANQQFPLNDIDYESSPAGLAQELSNLQAIRRMSMDVNTSDPDLPSFKSFNLPTAAPQHFSEDEEQDDETEDENEETDSETTHPMRTFPEHVQIHSDFPLLYRRFHVPSFQQGDQRCVSITPPPMV